MPLNAEHAGNHHHRSRPGPAGLNVWRACLRWTVPLLLLLVSACGPTGRKPVSINLQFHVIDGLQHTAPGETVTISSPVYDEARHLMHVRMARNESSGYFLLIRNGSTPQDGLKVRANAAIGPQGRMEASTMRFYRAWYVQSRSIPGWCIKSLPPDTRQHDILDVLVPIESPTHGEPFQADPGDCIYLWMDISIPANTPPGRYDSSINVLAGDDAVASIPLIIDVLPIELPQPTTALLAPVSAHKLLGHHLQVDGEPFAPNRLLHDAPLYEQGVALIQRTVNTLQQHGLSPYVTGLYPLKKIDERGELILGWQAYDEVAAPLIDGTLYAQQAKLKYWPIPFDESFPKQPPYDALTSPNYTRTLREYLALCREHFWERGWLDEAFVMLPTGAMPTESAFRKARGYGGIVRLASGSLQVACRLPPQDLGPYGWEQYPYQDLTSYVDIWCPPAQFFDPAAFMEPGLRLRRKWLSVDRPPYSGDLSLHAPRADVRVLPWQARALGAEALLLPEVNNWSDSFDQADPTTLVNRQPNPLILPGKFCGLDEPIPTVRLKMLREGANDLGYLQLCASAGFSKTASAILNSLSHYCGAQAYGAHLGEGRFDAWQRDSASWTLARHLMVELLTAIQADESELLNSVEWQRFVSMTQQVLIQDSGVRIHYEPAASRFRIEVHVVLSNHQQEPASVAVTFGELPLGWQTMIPDQSETVLTIPPRSSKPVSLAAVASNIPITESGRLPIPVFININNQGFVRYDVPLAHVTAQSVDDGITLDGDLSDWPLGITNVVTDFVPLSGAPAGDGHRRADLNRDVIGYACVDRQYLYLGFQCATTQSTDTDQAHRNYVKYDDRVPIENELLEILIDPSNAGSSTPTDLFHIAIMPTGACFEEQGIATKPQIGFTTAWAGHTQVETTIEPDQWTAELRIPLDAFGTMARTTNTWGINFCRFDQGANTYKNWSGARWNIYNPASLGNISFTGQ